GGGGLRTAVVPVLPDLGDEEPRAAAVLAREAVDVGADGGPVGVVAELAAVDAGDRAHLGVVAAPDLLECVRYLADGRTRARGVDGEREDVAVAGLGRPGQCVERPADRGRVARLADPLQARDLRLADGRVV